MSIHFLIYFYNFYDILYITDLLYKSAAFIMSQRIILHRNLFLLRKPDQMSQLPAVFISCIYQDLPGNSPQQHPRSFPDTWFDKIDVFDPISLRHFFYLIYSPAFCQSPVRTGR